MNDVFLDRRYLLKRYLNTHVSACDHYPVSRLQDLVNVVYAVDILDFCNNANIEPAKALREFSQVIDVCGRTHKACGNEVKAHFRAEFEVVHITLAEIGH